MLWMGCLEPLLLYAQFWGRGSNSLLKAAVRAFSKTLRDLFTAHLLKICMQLRANKYISLLLSLLFMVYLSFPVQLSVTFAILIHYAEKRSLAMSFIFLGTFEKTMALEDLRTPPPYSLPRLMQR